MASKRQALVLPQKKGGIPPMGKQKVVAVAADAKNRRALEDIGNQVNARVVEGRIETQVNRPITRSFGAQLLANEQNAAAVNKKSVTTQSDQADVKVCAKPAKKVAAKRKEKKNVEIIVISPDSNEEKKYEAGMVGITRKSSRKKATSLTSVLTARSKVACELSDKLKELVVDIDASDKENQLAAVDYVEDIYKYYKSVEHSFRPCDYMDSQVEINVKMRAILVDWLIEVHDKFVLMPETLYLTSYIIDLYLSTEMTPRNELQLVGVSAMLIASKYEELWAPEVSDFICIADRTYTREQILRMEKRILDKLQWNLTVPTPYVFLVRFVKAAECDTEMNNMVFFFAELALVQYSLVTHCPSMVAAASVFAARCTLKKSPLWTETLKFHTGFSEQQLLDCTQILVNSHASAAAEGKLKVAYKKYSHEHFGAVALYPPATEMMEELTTSKTVP
ncbi:G2/mitotic-specific cyclin S13-7-like [Zingiber officinale]|uniref:G2/mitotic-specific cyclin S13-7-like n=1 Tax=Zingiber officinale TaxID=94328 RepID=UPI001C4A9B05|nr:G2/mitotic-specific cyclin S13-7-like [Zingiber officinale]